MVNDLIRRPVDLIDYLLIVEFIIGLTLLAGSSGLAIYFWATS